VQAQSARK